MRIVLTQHNLTDNNTTPNSNIASVAGGSVVSEFERFRQDSKPDFMRDFLAHRVGGGS